MKNFDKIKKFGSLALGVLVFAIGVKMVMVYDCPTPPAMSGVAFMLIGFSMWFQNCMMLDYLCGKSGKK